MKDSAVFFSDFFAQFTAFPRAQIVSEMNLKTV
jgi:hypothetical protein